jgi:uncharacterized membrane protein YbhN (UPF0104 family)
MSEAPAKKRSPRAAALLAIKLLVTVGLLAWLGRSIAMREGMDELTSRAEEIAWAPMLGAIGLHFVAVLAGVLRWRTLLAARGLSLPLPVLVRSFLVGRFLGAFTPSTTGLDGYRLWDVGRRTGDTVGSAATIAIEKLVGLVGMAVVCAALFPFGLAERLGNIALLVALAMAGVAIVGLSVVKFPDRAMRLIAHLPRPIRTRAEKIASASLGSGIGLGALSVALVLGIAQHLALSATFAASGVAFGVAAPIPTLLSVGNAIVIAVLLPISIGGVGVRESVAVVLLAGAGIETSEAVLLALGSWLAGQVPALIGGLAMLAPDGATTEKKNQTTDAVTAA